ncbi:MAG: CPBP family intramembrane glutamic endopeptidase [Pseudomonadota bacterium]
MADRYAPNSRLTAHLGDPGHASAFVLAALGVYLGWFFLREGALLIIPEAHARGATRWGFFVQMMLFGLLIALTIRTAHRFHRVDWRGFVGERSQVARDFARVFGACMAVYAVFVLLGWSAGSATMRPLGGWLAFLPVALFGIAIQTGAEELFFRGYLHHYATAFLKRPIQWIIVPSLAFGLVHALADTSSTAASLAYVAWTFAFGVAAVDLTARSGSLGAAWGLHMAANSTAFCLAAEDGGPMSGAALFLFGARAPETIPETAFIVSALLFELLFLFVLWLAARNAIER